jgi:hypothetical protein
VARAAGLPHVVSGPCGRAHQKVPRPLATASDDTERRPATVRLRLTSEMSLVRAQLRPAGSPAYRRSGGDIQRRSMQLDGLFETLIGDLVTTAGNHRCMFNDEGSVPSGDDRIPATTRGRRADARHPSARLPGTCQGCSAHSSTYTRWLSGLTIFGRLPGFVQAVVCTGLPLPRR